MKVNDGNPTVGQDVPAPAPGDVSRLADHLFRHEAGKLVSILTGLFGIDRLQLAEDVVQEALARALQTWPYHGIPRNPAAWLTQTAKNLALDVIRREKLFSEKQPQIIAFIEHWAGECNPQDSPSLDNEIRDGRLRLMFACCHPDIPQDAQAALALKTLCGFSANEIAHAFLTTEAAIAKRLVRARQNIRELNLPFEIPSNDTLSERLDGVLQTLYLLFNEGYKASQGEKLVRAELCFEAIRLTTILASHAAGDKPPVHALAALMLFNAARFSSRMDSDGKLARLEHQDRSLWDQSLIAQGMYHLSKSAVGTDLTVYHLEAGIAARHCAATDYASTNWQQILALYDQLVRLNNSPVVLLNRAVAVAKVHGPQHGIDAVQDIESARPLHSYHLYYAVLAEFEAELGRDLVAAAHLKKALELTEMKSEQLLLRQRLAECKARLSERAA